MVPHDFSQSIKSFLGLRADWQGVGMGRKPLEHLVGTIEPVHFVEHELPRLIARPNLIERREYRVELLLRRRVGHIDDDQKQVALDRLFQCRSERRNEVVGKIANEPDRVAEQDGVAVAQRPLLDPRRQRRKELVVRKRPAGRQPIEHAGLAGIRVPDQPDRVVILVSVRHFAGLASVNAVQFLTKPLESPLHQAAVNLELLLARATRADADRRPACDLPKVIPHGAEPWIGVLQLGDLDLQAGSVGRRSTREDVQNQLAAVDDLDRHRLLQIANLRGRQIVVKDRDGRAD